ncbi:uncharacterized protein BX664DRAFT_300853 [Halteromyces radiatus]|uniref:uncharacterized protein n=1 Tax=Halteromyces radiatus TaxID=101107 RepID=UPI00221EF86F|nr:uncharacterized protein BX664DRAFT_300853 [Halteromyces radiatus]KAI8085122.1 hypothetical protein BX664DRAFT_300853 [Halteromyces radiatus]
MTDKLPPNLLKLFAPRPPLNHLPPLDKNPEKRIGAIVTGIAQYVPELRNYDSSYVPWKTAEEKRKEKIEQRKKKAEEQIAEGMAKYDPNNDPNIQGDPFHTLFVSHLSYKLNEEDLTQEFEIYGPIKHLRLVKGKDGQSRGYAFIEFEREKDMKAAYKDADGMKLFGRRIQVDVERGRTVKNWKPRRLGGGLGNTRAEKKPDSESSSSSHQHNDIRGSSRDRYSEGRYDRGSSRSGKRSRGDSDRYGSSRDYDDRRRSKRSRSRSPRNHRDRYSSGRRERSRDRGSRRDRYM